MGGAARIKFIIFIIIFDHVLDHGENASLSKLWI